MGRSGRRLGVSRTLRTTTFNAPLERAVNRTHATMRVLGPSAIAIDRQNAQERLRQSTRGKSDNNKSRLNLAVDRTWRAVYASSYGTSRGGNLRNPGQR
jgi:hypothetical protein